MVGLHGCVCWDTVIPVKLMVLLLSLSLVLVSTTTTGFTVDSKYGNAGNRGILHPNGNFHPNQYAITSSSIRSLHISGGSTTPHKNKGKRIFQNKSSNESSRLDATVALVKNGGDNTENSNGGVRRIEKKVLLRIGAGVLIAGILGSVYYNNKLWFSTVIFARMEAFKNKANEVLIELLDNLSNSGTKGLAIYTLGFMLFEMTAGITTPVETAAGMAFGVKKGILANAVGKTLGGVITFLLGRYLFFDYVHSKMSQNEILQLVEESIQETPVRVAVLLRLSPLPEIVKLLGASIFQPLRLYQFLLSLLIHGFPFTCLWTCLGAETSRVLRGAAPSTTLKVLISALPWFGVFTTSLIGIWIKGLRDKKQQKLGNT